MIKNIIFDLGGVVLIQPEDVTGKIISHLFNASPQASEIYLEHRIKLSKGEIAAEELIDLIKISHDSKIPTAEVMDTWLDLYKEFAKQIDGGVLDLVDQLKKKFTVYLFSDTIEFHDRYNSTRGIYERFHKVFKSYEEKLSKKENKEAFEKVLNKIGAKGDECIFIDDKEGNVKHAEETGMIGIHYKNLEQLKEELKLQRVL